MRQTLEHTWTMRGNFSDDRHSFLLLFFAGNKVSEMLVQWQSRTYFGLGDLVSECAEGDATTSERSL